MLTKKERRKEKGGKKKSRKLTGPDRYITEKVKPNHHIQSRINKYRMW